MPKLRPLHKKEDIERVPVDQPVLIETALPEEKVEEPILAESGTDQERIKAEPEPKVEPEKQEDDRPALLKRLEEAQRAEKASRDAAIEAERQRQIMLAQIQERDGRLASAEEQTQQAQYDAILNALGAAQAETEAASRDIQVAIAANDTAGQVEAYRRLARAEATTARLEDGKTAFEARREASPKRTETRQEPPRQQDPVEAAIVNMPDAAKTWLRAHPEYILDREKNQEIQGVHWYVTKTDKKTAYSPEYFERMEEHLGLRQKQAPTDDNEDEPPPPRQRRQESVVTSAPVTREAPSMGGGRSSTRITLTPEQREAARIAGVDEVTYARNLLLLRDRKANGEYTGRP